MVKELRKPEFLFTLYVYGFAMLRPILHWFNAYSTSIIAIFIGVISFLYILGNHAFQKQRFVGWICFSVFFFLILVAGNNQEAKTYSINFIMYGIITIFLMLNITDYNTVLYWALKFSYINGVLLVLDPFFNYAFNGGYMEYGFNMLMFSYSGLIVGVFYFQKRYLLVPLVLELVMITFYGNKGAGLTAVCLLLVAMMMSGSSTKRTLLSAISCLILVGWKTILSLIINLSTVFGVESYAINTMRIMASDNSDLVFSARTLIWEKAKEWIAQDPIFGNGVGVFETAVHGYAHNIFYDILLAFGFVGLFIFIVLLVHSIVKLANNPCVEYKSFQLLCLICWIIPMQFSLTLWNVILFWVYWGLYLNSNTYVRWKFESISADL